MGKYFDIERMVSKGLGLGQKTGQLKVPFVLLYDDDEEDTLRALSTSMFMALAKPSNRFE